MSTSLTPAQMIHRTYGSQALIRRLLEDLEHSGCDPEHLSTDDLRAFDELHVMGREATLALGRWGGLHSRMHVLDIGCGLGGTVRTLAEKIGGQFTGVDLAPTFVEAAAELTRRVGLGDRIAFLVGDTYRLPLADDAVDAVSMIHVNMNLTEKPALWKEIYRVLKPGASLIMWELCRGDGPPVVYPVPWADDPSFSHLIPPAQLVEGLTASGFEAVVCEAANRTVAEWLQARQTSRKPAKRKPPRVDLDLILPDFVRKRTNIAKNVLQNSITVVRCKATKPN